MNEPQIFSEADLSKLNKVLQGCTDWLCVANKLKASGLDVDHFIAELQAQQEFAGKLKGNFFPNHP